MGLDEFWASTPREVGWHIEAAAERQQQEIRLAKMAGYYAAGLQRTKKMPDLRSFLGIGRPAPGVRQSPEAMRERMLMLAAMCGGTITTTKGES